MINNENLNEIEKTFNNFKIKIDSKFNSFIMTIYQTNTNKIFESSFNIDFLHTFKLFKSINTIQDIIECIYKLIDQKKIIIEIQKEKLKIILLSLVQETPNVKLILKQKDILLTTINGQINEMKELKEENLNEFNLLKKNIENLSNKIILIEKDYLAQKDENKNIKQEFKLEINNLKDKINLIEKENKSLKIEINKLNDKITSIKNKNQKKENESLKESSKKNILNDKTTFILEKENKTHKEEVKNNENKINEKKKIILKHEFPIFLEKINLKNIKSLKAHDDSINSISTFPSGNIVSVSADQSIKIYDINLNILQNIKNAHDKSINYIDIKDEKNFITCSDDKKIKLWIKKENDFQINQIIENAHDDIIWKVIYDLNNNIISCSSDNKIKFWKENNNKYKVIKMLTHSDQIYSILLIEDKNILISSGLDGSKLWDLNNYKLIIHFKETCCGCWNGLCRIDEDKIIINGNDCTSLKIISLSQKKIVREIKDLFYCNGICLIEKKGIFLVGGVNQDIKIFRSDNYECLKTIKNAHLDDINGFCKLNNNTIVSYGYDKNIKIWSF